MSLNLKSSFETMKMTKLIICQLLFVYTTILIAQPKFNLNCDVALKQCTSDMTCGMILHDYRISCKQELSGVRVDNCSEICQLSIVSLVTISQGRNYLHCDCSNYDYCKTVRNRMQNCYEQVNLPIADTKNIQARSCRVTEMYCQANSQCLQALDYYKQLCESAIQGNECTRRCNHSISLLKRQRWGHDITQCVCDGGNADKCLIEKNNIQNLCFTSKASIFDPNVNFIFLTFVILSISI